MTTTPTSAPTLDAKNTAAIQTAGWKGRSQAPLKGVGFAALIVLVLFCLAYLGLDQVAGEFAGIVEVSTLIVGGLALVVGIVGRFHAAKIDRQNFEIAKITPASLAAARPGQIVWLDGTLRADTPVAPPETDVPCVWFKYTSRVMRQGKAADTQEESKMTDAWLVQGENHKIRVPLTESTRIDYPRKRTGDRGQRMFTLEFIENGKFASVAGKVARDKDDALSLTDIGPDAPVLVTPRHRSEWIDRAEAKEVQFGIGAAFLVLVGTGMAVGAGAILAQLAGPAIGAAIGLIAGLAVTAPMLALATYGRFVGYRTRVEEIWSLVCDDFDRRKQMVEHLLDELKKSPAPLTENQQDICATVRETFLAAHPEPATTGPMKTRIGRWLARQTQENERSAVLVDFLVLAQEKLPHIDAGQSLTAVEDEIAFDRTLFNAVARDYNSMVETFPYSLPAKILGFVPVGFWSRSTGETPSA